VPLSKIQSDILLQLAAHRNPESYVAGAIPLNRDGPRFSDDIDIFHDREESVAAAAAADTASLVKAGFGVWWLRREPGIYGAVVERHGETTKLEWVRDSDFRFFPTCAMTCSAMCCMSSTLRPTRPWQQPAAANRATCSIF
jgi:hypothetical protein